MNSNYISKMFLSLTLIFAFVGIGYGQEILEQKVMVCADACITFGKKTVKKHTYSWVLNGSGIEDKGSSIEICEANHGDFYTLRELNKKGKLVEDVRYKVVLLGGKVKVAAIDPCVLNGEPATIKLLGDYKSYKWSTGETTETIVVSSDSSVKVEVVDQNDCVLKKRINVKKQASNDIRDRLLKEGFHEIPIEIISKKKKKN